MKNQNEKTESVKIKRFTVLENGIEVLNTSKTEEIAEKVEVLKKEFKPRIIVLDRHSKTSIHHTKTIHQKNYRIEAGNYEKDSVVKPAPEVTETEE
jgi:hypothetical protein